jgi:hypothetical protein
MSNKINNLETEKNGEQPAENTVTVEKVATKAQRRVQNKKKYLQQVSAADAMGIAIATAHKRELELQAGCKVTRKQRAQMLRDMANGIQACANVGYRIKQGISPDQEMIDNAKQYPETLEQEIRDAAPHAPRIALEAAERAGLENLAAALAPVATAEHSAHQVAETQQGETEQGVEPENQAAALAPVAADTTRSPTQQREKQVGAIGRPSSYTQEEGDRICEWIQSGKSLNAYCKQHGRQAHTVYGWMRESDLFRQNYSRAHEDRADTLVEDMLDIADDLANKSDMVAVMAGKLRIETRKWIAERMRPTKYGAKIEVKQTGRVTFNLGVPRTQDAQVIDINPVQPALDKP